MAEWHCGGCGGANPDGMRFCGHCGAARAAEAPPAADPNPLGTMVSRQVAERVRVTGGSLPTERRLVTVLFADVSGFTPLAARLDPEVLAETISPVIARMASVISRHDGNVEKYAGDAVLAVFGAPVAHDDDADRALQSALDLHAEIRDVAAELGEIASGLELHIGVNSGHIVTGIVGSEARTDYVVHGDTVNTAQRLESVAPPGDTYVGALTRSLAGDRFEFEELEPLQLKGKHEPVPAWRLLGARQRAAAGPPALGRDHELAVLRPILGDLAGGGRVVLVTGEPGVGKSRLTAELRRSTDGVADWFETRCPSFGVEIPYWPFAELVRSRAGVGRDAAPDDALDRIESMLAPLGLGREVAAPLAVLAGFRVSDSSLSSLEPEALRRRLHEAVVRWLSEASSVAPAVLAIDDVHWADASSRELLSELARLVPRLPLLLLATSRGGHEDSAAALSVAAHPLVVPLDPLGPEATEDLCRQILGGPVSGELAEAVHARAGGNPLFVGELVRALAESGGIVGVEGVWALAPDWDEAAVPATIEGVLSARFDRLPFPAMTLLLTASVIGRRVPLRLLHGVETAVNDVGEATHQLVEAGLVERQGHDELVFHHALVQDTAYARLVKRRRRELHERTADVAEDLYGSGDDVVDLLARHLYLADAGTKAIDYLVRAGDRSRGLFANEEAIGHYGRALELARRHAEADGHVDRLSLELADLHELVGAYDDAAALYQEVGATAGDLRAWRGLAAVRRKSGQYPEALRLLDDVLAGSSGDSRGLLLERSRTLSLTGSLEEARAAAWRGLDADTEVDHVRGELLLQVALVDGYLGDDESALAHTVEAVDIFDRLGEARGLATALRALGAAYVGAGRHDEARDALQRGLETAERTGSVEEIGACLVNLGLLAVEERDWDTAIDVSQRAIDEFERVGHVGGRVVASVNLSEALLEAGRTEEARRACRDAIALARDADNRLLLADATRNLARVELRSGDPRGAARLASDAAAIYEEVVVSEDAARAHDLAAAAWRAAGEESRAEEAGRAAGACRA
jgi:class 3 adenylate cyclase/tetratricopeptide (TPR) repeat protein